jgi:hypothetical protein
MKGMRQKRIIEMIELTHKTPDFYFEVRNYSFEGKQGGGGI